MRGCVAARRWREQILAAWPLAREPAEMRREVGTRAAEVADPRRESVGEERTAQRQRPEWSAAAEEDDESRR